MASRKENLGNLFKNTRSRTIIILTAFFVLLMVILGLFAFRKGVSGAEDTTLSGKAAQRIRSIPGSADPTRQYSELVDKANLERAQTATATGKSSIPTIVRTEVLGKGKTRFRPEDAASGVGFASLSRLQREVGPSQGIWFDNLRDTQCGKSALETAINTGATVGQMRQAKCTPEQLIAAGYNIAGLIQGGYTATELRAAGFTANDLKAAGFDAKALRAAGFSACELKAAGFTAEELKKAGFTDGELKGAGFSDANIRQASGLPAGLTPQQIRAAGCSIAALQNLLAQGVSVRAIRETSGCSASALKAAGANDSDLLDSGYALNNLKDAGVSCAALRQAGSSAKDLLQSGACSLDELKDAGYGASEIEAARQATLPGGYTADALKKAGCSVEALKKARAAGVSASDIRKIAGCSAAQMKAAGFTAAELMAAGFSAKELKDAGFSAKELRAAGFSAQDLQDAGFSPAELKAAGFSAAELKAAGFSCKTGLEAGFSVTELRDAGCGNKELLDAGVKLNDLRRAGVKDQDLKLLGITCQALKDVGASARELAESGVCDLRELNRAGFKVDELKNAGFTEAEMKDAGVRLPAKPTVAAATDVQLKRMLMQAQKRSGDRLEQEVTKLKTRMSAASKQLISSWASPSQKYVAGNPPEDKEGATGTATSATAAGAAPGAPGATGAQPVVQGTPVKAGTILFAVLDTTVNSDEPGPVLASIVSGRFRGARLVGSLNKPKDAESVILNFNTMSVRGLDRSISISAVAVNEATARTGIASKVDKHLFQRYGALFTSSFMEGLGSTIEEVGSSISTTSGSTTISQAGRSAGENVLVALGTVGKRWAEQAEKQFDKPITVYVYSGTSLGILFTQDVVVPFPEGLRG